MSKIKLIKKAELEAQEIKRTEAKQKVEAARTRYQAAKRDMTKIGLPKLKELYLDLAERVFGNVESEAE